MIDLNKGTEKSNHKGFCNISLEVQNEFSEESDNLEGMNHCYKETDWLKSMDSHSSWLLGEILFEEELGTPHDMIGLHRDIDQANCKGFCSILFQSQKLLIEAKGTKIYMIHSSIGNLPSLDMDFHKI